MTEAKATGFYPWFCCCVSLYHLFSDGTLTHLLLGLVLGKEFYLL